MELRDGGLGVVRAVWEAPVGLWVQHQGCGQLTAGRVGPLERVGGCVIGGVLGAVCMCFCLRRKGLGVDCWSLKLFLPSRNGVTGSQAAG